MMTITTTIAATVPTRKGLTLPACTTNSKELKTFLKELKICYELIYVEGVQKQICNFHYL